MIFLQLVSELLVEDLGEPVYAWELPRVAGNACNGLTPTVALQLAAVVYGANLFSEPLEDLNAAWFLECLRTLILAWHCNEFVADLFLQCEGDCERVKSVTEVVETVRCFYEGLHIRLLQIC
eukprot:Gb_23060 [translate_table: standard]